jgi:predicted DCC family thiol-disulfide oxidoreductase YuxK
VRGTLIFDGDCAFCTWTAEWARRRLPREVNVTPWQFVEDLSRYGLTEDDVRRFAYWVAADGRAHRGHLAVAETWRAIGGGWGLLGSLIRISPFSWLAAAVYALVSRIRHRLPGSTPACQGRR